MRKEGISRHRSFREWANSTSRGWGDRGWPQKIKKIKKPHHEDWRGKEKIDLLNKLVIYISYQVFA